MADQRKGGITWTDETWNPVRGCSLVSAGCTNCYAMRQAARMNYFRGPYEGLTRRTPNGPVWTGAVRLVPEALDQPLRWQRPRRVFVNSMSDLFHERLSNEEIAAVFGVMADASRHTFQVLTKRPGRMRQWFEWVEAQRGPLTADLVKQGGRWPKADEYSAESVLCAYCASERYGVALSESPWAAWPLPNVWLLVSVEDQPTAEERIPKLLKTPAAIRGVSYEPALGPVDLTDYLPDTHDGHRDPRGGPWLDWVIVGGESGPNARPMHRDWARTLREQCCKAEVPFHFKQWGEWVGGTYCKGDGCPSTLGDGIATVDMGDGVLAAKVGKKAAGRLLDGKIWDEYPEGT